MPTLTLSRKKAPAFDPANPDAKAKENKQKIADRRERMRILGEKRDKLVRQTTVRTNEIARLLADGEDGAVAEIRESLVGPETEIADLSRAIKLLSEEVAGIESQLSRVLIEENFKGFLYERRIAVEAEREVVAAVEQFQAQIAGPSQRMRGAINKANSHYGVVSKGITGQGTWPRIEISYWLDAVERAVLNFPLGGQHLTGAQEIELKDFPRDPLFKSPLDEPRGDE
jgi:hypothetical protein